MKNVIPVNARIAHCGENMPTLVIPVSEKKKKKYQHNYLYHIVL